MLTFECPSCKTKLQVADAHAGKTIQCPTCKNKATAPKPELAADAIIADIPVAPVSDEPELASTAMTTPENAPASKGGKKERDRDDDQDDDRPRPRAGSTGSGGAAVAAGMGVGAIIGIVIGVMSCCICLPGLGIALLVPAVQKVQEAKARTQSSNNLKQIALAAHGFHDTHKFLPFNGNGPAVGRKSDSGSWAFQILPFIDQAHYFNAPQTNFSIPTFMCPGRARNTVVTTGASTDYMYNLCLNDQANGATPSSAVNKMQRMVGMTDGTSNTIFAGHGQISQGAYATANINGFADTINIGGTFGTARGTTANGVLAGVGPATNFGRDPAGASNSNTWGGPFSQGGLMAMGDGAVRLFPYTTQNLGAFLTPGNGEVGILPDT